MAQNRAVKRKLDNELASSSLNRRTKDMAFSIRNLSVLAYANGFTLWHYKDGRDTLESICTPDYMADAADMLADGDMIMISASDACAIRSIGGDNGVVRLVRLEQDNAANSLPQAAE